MSDRRPELKRHQDYEELTRTVGHLLALTDHPEPDPKFGLSPRLSEALYDIYHDVLTASVAWYAHVSSVPYDNDKTTHLWPAPFAGELQRFHDRIVVAYMESYPDDEKYARETLLTELTAMQDVMGAVTNTEAHGFRRDLLKRWNRISNDPVQRSAEK